MAGIPGRSPQTRAVLGALLDDANRWQHGYDIARTTGLKSGTLYPILVRLADRGLLDARWEDEQPVGRPRRHLYRLTADGVAAAREARAAQQAQHARATGRIRGRRPALEGS